MMLGVLAGVSSCKKHLEVAPPIDSINSDQAFAEMASIDQIMNSMYYNLESDAGGGNNGLVSASDDGYNPSTPFPNAQINNITSGNSNTITPLYWDAVYEHIYLANFILESVPGATALGFTDDKKKAYMAAAKTARAFTYFRLVRIFGDVPLITNTNVPVNAVKPRDPVATVYAAIEKDLQEAIAALPAAAGTPYFITNKYVPEAILAQVYLTEGKWALAEAAASDIINSNQYRLEALDDVFLQSSGEGIFVTAPVRGIFNYNNSFKISTINTTQLPDGAYQHLYEPRFPALSPSLLASFEAGDLRRSKWVTLRNKAGYADPSKRMFVYKYKYNGLSLIDVPGGSEEDNKHIRLAEIYLIRAEARARQANISGAASDLNAIRNRAGLGNTTAVSQTDMVNAVLNERRHELFFEEGHRWFDLVRTNTANAVLSVIPYKEVNWKPYMVLFPLDAQVLGKAPQLTQNPGY